MFKMKGLLICILVFLCSFTLLGCEKKVKLNFESNNIDIEILDEYELKPIVTNISEYKIIYENINEDIISLNENTIKALNTGLATIKAKVDGYDDTLVEIKVNVVKKSFPDASKVGFDGIPLFNFDYDECSYTVNNYNLISNICLTGVNNQDYSEYIRLYNNLKKNDNYYIININDSFKANIFVDYYSSNNTLNIEIIYLNTIKTKTNSYSTYLSDYLVPNLIISNTVYKLDDEIGNIYDAKFNYMLKNDEFISTKRDYKLITVSKDDKETINSDVIKRNNSSISYKYKEDIKSFYLSEDITLENTTHEIINSHMIFSKELMYLTNAEKNMSVCNMLKTYCPDGKNRFFNEAYVDVYKLTEYTTLVNCVARIKVNNDIYKDYYVDLEMYGISSNNVYYLGGSYNNTHLIVCSGDFMDINMDYIIVKCKIVIDNNIKYLYIKEKPSIKVNKFNL